MNRPSQLDQALEQRLASPLLDVLIRAGLILGLPCFATGSSPRS